MIWSYTNTKAANHDRVRLQAVTNQAHKILNFCDLNFCPQKAHSEKNEVDIKR